MAESASVGSLSMGGHCAYCIQYRYMNVFILLLRITHRGTLFNLFIYVIGARYDALLCCNDDDCTTDETHNTIPSNYALISLYIVVASYDDKNEKQSQSQYHCIYYLYQIRGNPDIEKKSTMAIIHMINDEYIYNCRCDALSNAPVTHHSIVN